ncbi:hypothetical protein BDY24DRAFT_382897 [Mrakia frigida]|uniref:uncharacterized protein n=1 Tax=Mrakia frigida TaxID=29902 RepID=UPI003FCBF249
MSHSTPSRPRVSGIPGPGPRASTSGLPTPSRRKSSLAPSEINTSRPPSAQEDETMSRALSDAMRQNPPSAFRSPQLPPEGSSFGLAQSQGRRPSSAASSNHSFYSAASSNGGGSTSAAPPMPRTPGGPGGLLRASVNNPSTPTAKSGASTSSSSQLGFTPRRSMAGSGISRPESRQESRPTSVRGVVGEFGVGEKVRVDSMGMEGTLRFVGEIAGKPGAWAGVELSGGFTGKGKNDGSVGETRYFTCPPMCGIFLQYSKLSSPTTGPGSARPSSVMSNRSSVRGSESLSGRVTPSLSGRATPSGRSTPSHNGLPRPPPLSSSLQQSRTASKSSAEASALAESNITAGSRASKYLGMTAKQLNSRTTNLNESVGSSSLSKSISTPRAPRLSGISGIGQPTPTRSSYAPRLSLGPSSTPGRSGRSSAAGVRSTPTSEMPPPPSPSKMLRPGPAPARPSSRQSDAFGSRPHSRASEVRPPTPKSSALLDLEKNNFTLQDKIAKLTRSTSASSSGRASVQSNRSSRRSSDASRDDKEDDEEENEGDKTFTTTTTTTSSHTDAEFEQQRLRIDQLRIRVDGLEKENLTLLLDGKKSPDPSTPSTNPLNHSRMDSVGSSSSDARAIAAERQVQAHATRLTILESELAASSQTARTLQTSIETLEQAALRTQEERAKEQEEAKKAQKELGTKLEESERLVVELRGAAEGREKAEREREEEARSRKKEIEGLQKRVERLDEELEQERNELGGQVDALRKAGQDTIMLYEERLNAAESLRFDMELALRSLSDQLDQQSSSLSTLHQAPPSPSSLSRQASTAAEIDNENLTEQVKHLTNKISSLEDQLEEMQVQAERDEAAANKKLERSKEAEGRLKGEVEEVRREMEEGGKREGKARERIGEVEEALKESGAALENARAEIEGLRAEVTNLENLQAGAQTDEHDQLKETATRADAERTRLEAEIETLKNKLEDALGEVRQAVETASQAMKDGEERKLELEELRADLKSALDDNDELLHTTEDLETKLKTLYSTPSSSTNDDALSELRQQHARENDLLVEEIRSLKRKLGSPVSPNGTEEFVISENSSPAIAQIKSVSKKGSRESLTGSVASRSSRLSIGAKDEEAVMRDQIRGFQHIIEELTKEASTSSAQLYSLKNEKDQLLAETEDLRDTVKALELTLEEGILSEEGKLEAEAAAAGLRPPPLTNGAPSSPSRDAARLAKQLAEAQVALDSQSRRHDADFERYQKKLAEIDQKNLREVHELESLIESKIYREDELEREIEDLKYEITKSGISKIKTNGHHALQSRRKGDDLTPKLGSFAAQKVSDGDACELCDDPTHDIQFCPLFSGAAEQSSYDPEAFDENELNSPLANRGHGNPSKGRPAIWCEDCESTDHSTEDCVYAQEVF